MTEAAAPEDGEEVPENFNYCPVESIRRSTEGSSGVAALTSILKYWDTEASDSELLNAYPLGEEKGYSIHKLQRIAIDKGLTAFALTMKNNPLQHLSEQLEYGRPILVTVRFPDGTYFGQPVEQGAPVAVPTDPTAPAVELDKGVEHVVVVFGQSEKQFLIMDPAFGVLSVDKATFEKYWKEEKYSALLCST